MTRIYCMADEYILESIRVQVWFWLNNQDEIKDTRFAHNPIEKRKDSDTGFAHPELDFIRAVRNGKTLWEFQTPRGAGICNFAAGINKKGKPFIGVSDWDGWHYGLDPETGNIIGEGYNPK